MRLGGRAAAAIEILRDVEGRRLPVSEALKDWGRAHRFAGSGDRAAIGNLVFDCLRWRASSAWRMGDDSPRAAVLAVLHGAWARSPDEIADAFTADPHAPEPLSIAERRALIDPRDEIAPDAVRADVPDWIWPDIEQAFGPEAVTEGQALAARAGLDLRVNVLKADRPKCLKSLARLKPEPTPLSPWGIRIAAGVGPARPPSVASEAEYRKGRVEIQDEGSQIAALLTGARPGQQVLDFCAGGGGKTLALAGMLGNKGQIYAYDADRRRLANSHERLQRAGARNVQVRDPAHDRVLDDLVGRMDLVVTDVPCTGSGTWRRRPDSKWRVTPDALKARMAEQDTVLRAAAPFVRPGGRLAYITCSMLPAENDDRLAAFLDEMPDFAAIAAETVIQAAFPGEAGQRLSARSLVTRHGLQMTPRRTGCDGFYVAIVERHA